MVPSHLRLLSEHGGNGRSITTGIGEQCAERMTQTVKAQTGLNFPLFRQPKYEWEELHPEQLAAVARR